MTRCWWRVSVVAVGLALAPMAWAQVPKSPEGLAAARDCYQCHRVEPFKPGEGQTLGPAFKLVAQRYRGNKGAEDYLVKKILNGGNGAWGGNNMPPQVLTEPEARTLVRWVLKLKH